MQSDDARASVKISATGLVFKLLKKASGHNWTIKPIGTQSGFKATAEVADKTQGSAIAAEIASSEFELKATANPGYSFDYWLVKSDSSKITENPKTVTLTAKETYTAYFREWKQAFATSDPPGMTTATGETSATATRKLDDTWTLEGPGRERRGHEVCLLELRRRPGLPRDGKQV